MDFGFTEEQENLRKEISDFYLGEIPRDFDREIEAFSEETQAFLLQLQRKAGAKGYLTPGWDKDSGGLGLSAIEQGIAAEESARYVWPLWPNIMGLNQTGPALHLFGTKEQKNRFLPGIAKGQAIWFQCFTEPEAGSDEANQQTRAVDNGDHFVINGRKCFISGTFKPDYLYTLARTADVLPKHRGLSLFLIPADSPGISFRPMPNIGHDTIHNTNEICFDDVIVPRDYLLGETNKGFYYAMATLDFERTGTGNAARSKQLLQELVQFCKEERRNGKPLFEDPKVREMLARRAVETEVHRLLSWYGVWWFSQRQRLGPQPYDVSAFFNRTTGMQGKANVKDQMDMLGLYGQLRKGSKWAKFGGRMERSWLTLRNMHGGGTVEIQKVVLAQKGLGLPRQQKSKT